MAGLLCTTATTLQNSPSNIGDLSMQLRAAVLHRKASYSSMEWLSVPVAITLRRAL